MNELPNPEGLRPTQPIKVLPEDGEFYINRLIRLCVLRQEIDAGNMGFANQWGTDKAHDPEVYTTKNGETKVRHRIESLPIRSTGRRERGLRYGVLFSIWGTRNFLHEMGLGEEADAIILFDKTMPGGNNGR